MQLQEFTEALAHLNSCIETIREIGAEISQEMLWVYSQLGQLYYTRQNYDQALSHLKTSKILSEELQIRDIEYGTILLYIGKIRFKQNDKQEALYYLSQSRRVLESINKEDSLEAILALLELYLKEGNTLKSWELLQEIEAQSFSPCASAMAENEMGNLLREFGYNSQAMRFYESALKKYEILKGGNSLEVAKLYLNIGALYIQQGKYVQAHEYLCMSRDVKLMHFSENNVEMASVYEELGTCLKLMGRKGVGRDLMGKAMKIYRENGISR